MRNRALTAILGASLLAALLAAPGAPAPAAAPKAKLTLAVPKADPKLGVRWFYTVRATAAGKPVAGVITAEIVDPLGSAHPVEYAATKKPIVKRKFRGVFRDYVLWPAEARGIPLTFRVTVAAGGARKVFLRRVTPRS
jgi:hypothetical protein